MRFVETFIGGMTARPAAGPAWGPGRTVALR